MKLICGIDEAGRGALLGPLIVAGACFAKSKLKLLKEAGVKDSKLLTAKKREELFDKIKGLATSYKILRLEPSEIDSRWSCGKNLNTLELELFIAILNELQPEVAYIDSLFRNTKKLKELLSTKTNAKLIVEHKADSKHLVVAAASILAKVMRDKAINDLKQQTKKELGSGYPSDSVTVQFVKNHPKASFIRKSWQAYKNIEKEREQRKLDFSQNGF